MLDLISPLHGLQGQSTEPPRSSEGHRLWHVKQPSALLFMFVIPENTFTELNEPQTIYIQQSQRIADSATWKQKP